MKSFESLWSELLEKATSRPEGSATVAAIDAGVHSIGKKVLEEAGEVCQADQTWPGDSHCRAGQAR